MKKSRIVIEIIAFLLTAVITVTGLMHLGDALLPAHYDYGSAWDIYLTEEPNSIDAVFFGSSLSYCDIIPAKIYTQSSIKTFVNAGSFQTLAVSRQYLEESLKTQSPSTVFLEITGAFYDQYTGYSTLNVIYMPYGMPRLRAGLACEEKARLAAIFPLYETHDRVFLPDDVRIEDPQQAKDRACSVRMHAGFTFREEGNPQIVSDRTFNSVPGTKTYEDNVEDIRSFAEYCEKNGVRLVLYIAPCMGRIPADLRRQLFDDLKDVPYAALEDWSELGETLGIDPETDWYDSVHMNVYGAAKFSAFLSGYIEQLGLTAKTGTEDSLWQQRVEWWKDCCKTYDIPDSE